MARYKTFDLVHLVDQVISHCHTCLALNPSGPKEPFQEPESGLNGQRLIWKFPIYTIYDYIHIDYTEIKPGTYGYKYLLVFIDTFSGWVEAYPAKETANAVAKKVLEDIIPR